MKIRPSVVVIQDRNLLLLKYDYNGNVVYGIPGGNPDTKESLALTVVREIEEELSISVRLDDIVFVGEIISDRLDDTSLHCVFTGDIISGNPKLNPVHTSALGISWEPIEKLDSLNLYPNIGVFLKNKFHLEIKEKVYNGTISQKWF